MQIIVLSLSNFNSTHYLNVASISYDGSTGKYTITQTGGSSVQYTATDVLLSILPM